MVEASGGSKRKRYGFHVMYGHLDAIYKAVVGGPKYIPQIPSNSHQLLATDRDWQPLLDRRIASLEQKEGAA